MITPYSLLLVMAIIQFVLGLLTFTIGLIILAKRVPGKEMRSIAEQTSRLAQKGFTEEIVGLVGNASNLVEAMSELVRTTAGIGVFLCLLGLFLIGFGCYVMSKLLPAVL